MMYLIYMGETKVDKTEWEGFLNLLRQNKILKYNPNEKEAIQNASTTIEVSANLVLIVYLIIKKVTVKTTWLDITAVKVHVQNIIVKFVNSEIVEKGASEKQIVNTLYLKTPKPKKQ